MEGCRTGARKEGLDPEACVLYASVLPKTLPSNTSSASGLGEKELEAFERYKAKHKPGTYGAFAISDLDVYSTRWDQASAAQARENALEGCLGRVASDLADDPFSRDVVRRLSLDKCRIVHEFGP